LFLIILLLTVLILFVSISRIRGHYLDTLSLDMEKLGTVLKPRILSFLENTELEEMDAWSKNLGRILETRITIVDKQGLVLADSDEDPKVMVNHRYRPEIAEAFSGRIGRSIRFSNTVKADMLYIGLPLEEGNIDILHVLRLSLYVSDIDTLLSELTHRIWLIGLAFLLAGLIASYAITRTLTRPLREIIQASQRMASGDFSSKLTFVRKDELGELAGSFNFMTERIQTLFEELDQQKEEMESIITSIEEGILALDRQGRILFHNAAFQALTGLQNISRKFYWEVLRKQSFDDLIKKTQKNKQSFSQEIEFDERTLLCHTVYLENREGIVVTFYDITRLKNIEVVKKDFVDNVSHELNTPLTAIKGFVETLAEETDPKHSAYLDIIKRNTDRLIHIVRDLLTLSELEEKDLKLQFEEVSLPALIESILPLYKAPMKSKNLRLALDSKPNLPSISGDPFKLEQLFINLVDNAVKYTETGTIRIKIQDVENGIQVEIADTGIGIPENRLPRIFERFYVVDKSRSRKEGGTGLGLSIVKHIVQMHGASIEVSSRRGEGTCFKLVFPLSVPNLESAE
jgi:two-component system phosphate regulon sensor histidine kinase PhoR